jgi:hypothetical protein
VDSLTASYTLSQRCLSGSLLITAFRRGLTRSISKSSELIEELSLAKSLKRFLPPLLERRRRDAGRIWKAEMRSSARF